MAIDPTAVGSSGGPQERSWTSTDCLLYALGVGAGIDELNFTTEKNQEVLPTFFDCCRDVELVREPRWVPFANLRRVVTQGVEVSAGGRVRVAGAVTLDGFVH